MSPPSQERMLSWTAAMPASRRASRSGSRNHGARAPDDLRLRAFLDQVAAILAERLIAEVGGDGAVDPVKITTGGGEK